MGGKRYCKAATKLVSAGLLATVPTALAGAADWSDTGGAPRRIGLIHAAGMESATVLQLLSWVLRKRGMYGTGKALKFGAAGSMTASGYLGGHLTLVEGIGVSHTAFQKPEEKWLDVLGVDELEERKPVRVTPGQIPVMVVKVDGEIFALPATCTHAGGPLTRGNSPRRDASCVPGTAANSY